MFTNEKYPQFLEVPEYDTERLVPMSPVEDKKETTIIEDIIELIKKLAELVVSLTEKIGNK